MEMLKTGIMSFPVKTWPAVFSDYENVHVRFYFTFRVPFSSSAHWQIFLTVTVSDYKYMVPILTTTYFALFSFQNRLIVSFYCQYYICIANVFHFLHTTKTNMSHTSLQCLISHLITWIQWTLASSIRPIFNYKNMKICGETRPTTSKHTRSDN